MKFPFYYKIREIPIKVEETIEGRKYYVFNIQTGQMELSTRYQNQVFGGIAGRETDLDELTREQFEKQILKMKNRAQMNKKIPFYCITPNSMAIKVVYKKGYTGALIPTSYVFNEKTKQFDYNMNYLTVAYGEQEEVKYLNKKEFNSYLLEIIKKKSR